MTFDYRPSTYDIKKATLWVAFLIIRATRFYISQLLPESMPNCLIRAFNSSI